MIKELADIISALAKFPILQLVLLAIVAVIVWYIWVQANKAPAPNSVDGNRTATLFDLLKLEQEFDAKIGKARDDAAAALSARSAVIFDRLARCEQQVAAMGEDDGPLRPPPRRRRHPQ